MNKPVQNINNTSLPWPPARRSTPAQPARPPCARRELRWSPLDNTT